jgi:Phage conserved hypothetical protein BR0599./Uncharacterized conserved protein (DUF2163).
MITLPTIMSEAKEQSSVFFIDLYVLTLATGTLHYAACDEDISWYIPGTSTAVTYSALPIERNELKQSVDNKVDNVTIKIANCDDAFTSVLLQSFDLRGSNMDIYQISYPGSLTDPDAYKYTFAGFLDAPALDLGKATFEATLEQRLPNLESYRTVGQSCNAWFGDEDECGVTQDSKTSTVGANSTQYVIYDSSITQSDDYWANGVCVIGYETKKIISSAKGSITVEYPFYSTPTKGTSYTILTGCNHTQTNCKKYGNLKNFGGFPCVNLEYNVKS